MRPRVRSDLMAVHPHAQNIVGPLGFEINLAFAVGNTVDEECCLGLGGSQNIENAGSVFRRTIVKGNGYGIRNSALKDLRAIWQAAWLGPLLDWDC